MTIKEINTIRNYVVSEGFDGQSVKLRSHMAKSGIIRPGQAGVHRWFTQAGLALNRPKCAM